MMRITADNGSRQIVFVICMCILVFSSIITVTLRLYCRAFTVRHVGLDDYFMLAALAVVVAMSVMNIFHISWGTGRHTSDLDVPVIIVPLLKHWYAYQIVYPWALFFVKSSILALYHRIFLTQIKLRYAIYVVAAFVSVFTIVITFVNVFECKGNISHAWSPVYLPTCNNIPATYFSAASFNILTDIVILVLPMRSFRKLKLATKKLWTLVGIFMFGALAVIASIMRLYALWKFKTSRDTSYESILVLLFSQIEVNVAIISASAPALRPLFRRTLNFWSSNQSKNYGVYSGTDHTATPNLFRLTNRTQPNSHQQRRSVRNNDPSQTSKVTSDITSTNTSEERILGHEGIVKMTETRVHYEERSFE